MRQRDRLVRAASAEGLLAAALAGAALVPPALAERGPNLCLISRVIGRSCPACGMSRAWVAMAHGDVARSFAWHPLGPFAYVLATVLVLGHYAPGRARG
jgi:Protein of unknown function (DUF2752)